MVFEIIVPSILVVWVIVATILIFTRDKNGEYKFFNKAKKASSENTQDMYTVNKYIYTYRSLDDAIHKKNPTDYMLTPGYSFKILKDWGHHDRRCYKIVASCDTDTGVALTYWINDSENQSHILKELIEE